MAKKVKQDTNVYAKSIVDMLTGEKPKPKKKLIKKPIEQKK